MSSFRHPFSNATDAYHNFYGAVTYRLEPLEPELEPVAQKKSASAKDTGRVNKLKAVGSEAKQKKTLTRLLSIHLMELRAVWQAYARIPTVQSRREWAAARSLEPGLVHRWFKRQKGEDHSLPEYALAVGTPPKDDDEIQLEDPVIKPEPLELFLPWERSFSVAPTLVNPVQFRIPSGRSQRSAIFISDGDRVHTRPVSFLDESSQATSEWLKGLSDLGPFMFDDKPFPPASVSAPPGSNLALHDTNQPASSHFVQTSQTLHNPAHSVASSQPTAFAPVALADPLPPPLTHSPAHHLQTAFHTSNDFVPPWLLPPPDCVMIPRALCAALAKTARMYAPEIFPQFPLYDFLNLA